MANSAAEQKQIPLPLSDASRWWIDQRFAELMKLADERFGEVRIAETQMLRAVITGIVAYCGPTEQGDDPCNTQSANTEWGSEREINAGLLRWLCVDKAAEAFVDSQGINIHGAKISGDINLSFSCVRFPLRFQSCRLTGTLRLRSAQLTELDLSGSTVAAMRAENVNVKGGVFLTEGFNANGAVRLVGGTISGSLDCRGGTFKNRKEALNAEGARVGGTVFLSDGFEAMGEVSLQSAQIGGSLQCDNANFTNPQEKDSQEGSTALNVVNARIIGDVFLRSGFKAKGEVSLLGTHIDGDLDCEGGSFNEITVARATIKGDFLWRKIENVGSVSLDLGEASTGSLVDDKNSWFTIKNLTLDGFTYGRIADGPKDYKTRQCWLNRQQPFAPQPYRQLAKVLCEDGDNNGARRVLFQMESVKHKEGKHSWVVWLWRWMFRLTIGYGLYPMRALWALLLIIVVGWGVYRYEYFAGVVTPTNRDAYAEFQRTQEPPKEYQHFYALIYSAENSFPLANLGQREAWAPNPNQQGEANGLRFLRWFQILSGWLLTTFFVAGVTGIARKD